MKNKILQQVFDILSAKIKEDNAPREFRLGKDLITACSAGDNPDSLHFVDCSFHSYQEAHDFLISRAKEFVTEYHDYPHAQAIRNHVGELIGDAVGRMKLSDYNSQKSKDRLVKDLRYIVSKTVGDYKNSGYDVNRLRS